MEGVRGDGNDVEAVFRLAGEAIDRARQGQGPTFMELDTYRWREHCGPNYDNHIGYRTEEEFLEWRKRCPIEKCQSRLIQDGLLSEQEAGELAAGIRQEIEDAFAYAKGSPFPMEDQLFTGVYADGPES